MKLPNFQYECPVCLEDAVRLLSAGDGEAKIISGGQSLLPMMAYRLVAPKVLVDLRKVPDLDRIDLDQGVRLGARVTWAAIEQDIRLQSAHPLLREAVRHIAHFQIRNRGTVGGSLAHADPAAEFSAVALCCGAKIRVIGTSGTRLIPADEFFLAPLVTALEEDEIITAIEFPVWATERRFGFKEYARRQGDFAMAGAVVQFEVGADGLMTHPAAVGFGVGGTPVRLPETEECLEGRPVCEDVFQRAARVGSAAVEVQSDTHADAIYRRALLETMLVRAFKMAASN